MTTAAFSPLLEQAVELSAQWHDRTYRKGRWRSAAFDVPETEPLGVPVMSHVTNVALMVQRAGWDEITVAAAFLHDVIEDANRFREALDFDQLAALIGEEVATCVLEVSEPKLNPDGSYRTWQQRKDDYLEGLRTASDRAMAVSLADKKHNLWTIDESLSAGIDVFRDGPGRRALSAGPRRQRWFYLSVLDRSMERAHPNLDPLRDALRIELQRFEDLIAGA